MIKECAILNGQIINIGPWDYQYQEIDGEQVAQNPFPEGATIEERNVEYDPDRGWYEVGTAAPKTEIELVKEENAQQNLNIIEIYEALIPLVP